MNSRQDKARWTARTEALAQQHRPHDGMCNLNNPICKAYVDIRIEDQNWVPTVVRTNGYDMNGADGSWSAEMSEIEQPNLCPACGHGGLLPSMFTRHTDIENELTHLTGTCPSCNAKLTIFND